MKTKIEYIWLDGVTPDQTLRSKTKIVDLKSDRKLLKDQVIPIKYELPNVEELPLWSFDGSSTRQAVGSSSDCVLKPVRIYEDPSCYGDYLVLCEVLDVEGNPHITNQRHKLFELDKQESICREDWWFGFEQEYVLMKDGVPLGFPKEGYPEPQGKYYCGVGTGRVQGRDIVEQHLNDCLQIGLDITGINAEVMLGQWEYQLFGKGATKVSDDLWISRYLLHRITEEHGITVQLHPKPIEGDWNGSGMHVNFSNELMRKEGGKEMIEGVCEVLKDNHEKHIELYGSNNEKRLTGDHETASIKEFSYGVSDRGASIRIPIDTAKDWKGYLEDRRPASNGDPYKITWALLDTLMWGRIHMASVKILSSNNKDIKNDSRKLLTD